MKINVSKKLSIAAMAILIPCMTKAQETQLPLELTLDKAIQIALSENPAVKIADVEIQKKKYARKSTQSALYPQIDLVGQYSRAIKKQVVYLGGGDDEEGNMMTQMFDPILLGLDDTFADHLPDYRPNVVGPDGKITIPGELAQNIWKNTPPVDGDGGMTMEKYNTWAGGFNLTWPVVVPALWKTLELTSLDVELAVENARSSKINMVNAIRKSFYGVLMAKEVVQVYQESYDNAVLNFNNINSKFQQGIVSEFDMIRANVNAKNIQPNLIQAQNAHNLATLSLKALMGIDMDQEISVSGNLFDYEQSLYEELVKIDTTLADNSDLRKFDIQNEQLRKTLDIYKAQYMPTVAITGNYMYMAMNDKFKFGDYRWNPSSKVGISVSIPIFDGFKKSNDIRQTKASLMQMEWQREDIVRNLKLAINSNLNNMTNYVEQVFSTKDVIEQARKGYEISMKLYDTGMGTVLDVNTAQLGLMQARLAFTQAIYNFLASKADLDKTLGIEIN